MTDRPVILITADGGEVIAQLDPVDAHLFLPNGTLPGMIHYAGRTFERGWTNDGNTDADERLWFEIA